MITVEKLTVFIDIWALNNALLRTIYCIGLPLVSELWKILLVFFAQAEIVYSLWNIVLCAKSDIGTQISLLTHK